MTTKPGYELVCPYTGLETYYTAASHGGERQHKHACTDKDCAWKDVQTKKIRHRIELIGNMHEIRVSTLATAEPTKHLLYISEWQKAVSGKSDKDILQFLYTCFESWSGCVKSIQLFRDSFRRYAHVSFENNSALQGAFEYFRRNPSMSVKKLS